MLLAFEKMAAASLPGYRTWHGPGHTATQDDRNVPVRVRLCGHVNSPETEGIEVDCNKKPQLWCRTCKLVELERYRNAEDYIKSDVLFAHKRCDMIWRCVEDGPVPQPYADVEVTHQLLRGRHVTNRLVGISFGDVDRSQHSVPTGDREWLINELGLPEQLVIDVRLVLYGDPDGKVKGTYHDKRHSRTVRDRVMQEPGAKDLLAWLYLDWQRYGVLAVGCKGSNHRSPSLLGMLEELAKSHGWQTCIFHFGEVRHDRDAEPEERDRRLEGQKMMLQDLIGINACGISCENPSWQPNRYYAHEYCQACEAARLQDREERASRRKKKQPCFNWQKRKWCFWADNCPYSHDPSILWPQFDRPGVR